MLGNEEVRETPVWRIETQDALLDLWAFIRYIGAI